MAIKPGDCVIRMRDLVISHDTAKNWSGSTYEIEVYESYWANFVKHVEATTVWESDWDAYDKNLAKQLAKFNAVYKETKNYDDRYVKFQSHRDLTFFVLRWS